MFYTVREVAKLLNMSVQTVRNHIRKGNLKGVKFNKHPNGRFRILEVEVERFISEALGEEKCTN